MPGTDSRTVSGRRRLVVIGGGIAGLVAALELVTATKDWEKPPEVLLFEGSGRLGGPISTYNLDDTILELGPDSFITDKPAGLELCKQLGIEERLIEPQKENRRTFVAHDGKLFHLPDGFMMMAPTELKPLMQSPLFTLQGKLRMLQELVIPKRTAQSDESLAQFVERRLGKEVLDRVVQPLVGGIYTSDPNKLSVQAALPRIAQLEQKHGSIIKGLCANKTKKDTASGARYGLFVTFDAGMGVMINALQRALPPTCIRMHQLVSRVRRHIDDYQIEFADGKTLACDGIIVATSAFHASDIVCHLDTQLSDTLRKIEYASSAVLNLIFRKSDIQHALDGFGFVVPATEKRSILACSFSSQKWVGRAPHDRVLLRVFVGGALQGDVFELADEQIECLVWQDLHDYLGIRGLPLLSVMSRFSRAMPQYNIGHGQRIKDIEESLVDYPSLALAGSAYQGVGIPDCIDSGRKAAQRILTNVYAQPVEAP